MRAPAALYYLNSLFVSPVEFLFTFLIFILGTSLGATPFQLTVMASVKPVTSIVSFYLGAQLRNNSNRRKPYLILINILGCLSCFFYPFMDNVWFYIFSYAILVITMRAATPAWVELLKNNYNLKRLSQIVSYGNSVYFAVMIVFPSIAGYFMERLQILGNGFLWGRLF